MLKFSLTPDAVMLSLPQKPYEKVKYDSFFMMPPAALSTVYVESDF